MEASGSGCGGGSAQAAPGTSSLLEAHDHTRLWLQSKLSGDWSAQAGASGLTEERLNALSRCFGTLDSMVKVRLLLAGLFVPTRERARLQPLLSELSSQAAGNQEEWVRATAAVVGDFSGLLDMKALMAQFPLVRESISRFSSQIVDIQTPPYLLPDTEQYMHRDIRRCSAVVVPSTGGGGNGGAVARQHFQLREPPPSAFGELAGGFTGGAAAAGGGGGLGCGPGGLLGGSGIGGGGGLMLPGLGSGGLGAASGSQALEGKGSLGSGPSPSGDALLRRGMAPGGGAGGGGSAGTEAASLLRSRAALTHSKEPKQGPPTPGGGGGGKSGSLGGGPQGLPPLRPSRAKSLVPADPLQQPAVPESPHGGGSASGSGLVFGAAGVGTTASAHAATAATAATAAAANFASTASTAQPLTTTAGSSSVQGGAGVSDVHIVMQQQQQQQGGSAVTAAAAALLPPLSTGPQAAEVASASAAGGGPFPPMTLLARRESLHGGGGTPRASNSWLMGGAATPTATTAILTTATAAGADARQFPLAAIIAAAAAAAASGDTSVTSGPFPMVTTAEPPLSYVPPYIQQLQQRREFQDPQHSHSHVLVPAGNREDGRDPQGLALDRARELYDDGFGAGNDVLDVHVGRRPSHQGVERAYSGGGLARRWSATGSGVGRQEDAHAADFEGAAEFHEQEEGRGGDEPDLKRQRAG